ncbi:MAG: hypothetical protein DMF98_08850 [Acidobacteria bacterium]|nr:MAG: hypothetical protein DMF98_08850 [Acidobacteriota bacterium]
MTTTYRLPVQSLVVVVSFFLITASGLAQTSLATLRGKAIDQQGGVLPGATVTVRHVETNTTRTSVTEATGQYFLPSLPAGTYELTVELSGFTTAKRTGTVQENVTVAGQAALVETQHVVGAFIDTARVENLPTVNRNFADLAQLAPGVSSTGGSSMGFSAAGQHQYQNNVFVDGATNAMQFYGTQAESFPQDWIQEFQVMTNGFQHHAGARVRFLPERAPQQHAVLGSLHQRRPGLSRHDAAVQPAPGWRVPRRAPHCEQTVLFCRRRKPRQQRDDEPVDFRLLAQPGCRVSHSDQQHAQAVHRQGRLERQPRQPDLPAARSHHPAGHQLQRPGRRRLQQLAQLDAREARHLRRTAVERAGELDEHDQQPGVQRSSPALRREQADHHVEHRGKVWRCPDQRRPASRPVLRKELPGRGLRLERHGRARRGNQLLLHRQLHAGEGSTSGEARRTTGPRDDVHGHRWLAKSPMGLYLRPRIQHQRPCELSHHVVARHWNGEGHRGAYERGTVRPGHLADQEQSHAQPRAPVRRGQLHPDGKPVRRRVQPAFRRRVRRPRAAHRGAAGSEQCGAAPGARLASHLRPPHHCSWKRRHLLRSVSLQLQRRVHQPDAPGHPQVLVQFQRFDDEPLLQCGRSGWKRSEAPRVSGPELSGLARLFSAGCGWAVHQPNGPRLQDPIHHPGHRRPDPRAPLQRVRPGRLRALDREGRGLVEERQRPAGGRSFRHDRPAVRRLHAVREPRVDRLRRLADTRGVQRIEAASRQLVHAGEDILEYVGNRCRRRRRHEPARPVDRRGPGQRGPAAQLRVRRLLPPAARFPGGRHLALFESAALQRDEFDSRLRAPGAARVAARGQLQEPQPSRKQDFQTWRPDYSHRLLGSVQCAEHGQFHELSGKPPVVTVRPAASRVPEAPAAGRLQTGFLEEIK